VNGVPAKFGRLAMTMRAFGARSRTPSTSVRISAANNATWAST
jgi:hypothetical protein